MAVLVVYERDVAKIEPLPALMAILDNEATEVGPSLDHLLIYENSTAPRARPAAEHAHCTYVHDPNNGGTAAAYSAAATLATNLHITWLLLLDHDTLLPPTFFRSAASAFAQAATRPPTAVLLPRVRHRDGRLISPVIVTSLGSFRSLGPGQVPHPGQHVSAIASGAILRVDAFRDLLPLPPDLWLDYVDHWVFARLHKCGLTTLVFDETIQHDLSIESPSTMSTARLDSVLRAEARFHSLLGPLARLAYPVRLGLRILRFAFVDPRLAVRVFRSIMALPARPQ